MLTFVIIGVVSNVTLTNQQDYYGVKQTSEASSYDALDTIAYKKGICVCAAEGTTKDASGRYVINKRTQYTITEPDDNNNCESKERCELRLGEYVINPKLFNENIIVRLGSIIKASEVYDIKVQEIIPYPPKISVYISYHQALNVEGDDRINSEIPNKLDGIFEDTGTQSVLQYKENTLADWPLNCGTPDTNTYCYYDKDGSVSNNKWKFCPELTDEAKCTAAGYEAKIQVSSASKCVNTCFCRGTQCGVYAKVDWGDGWEVQPMEKCGEEPAEEPENRQTQSSTDNCKAHFINNSTTCNLKSTYYYYSTSGFKENTTVSCGANETAIEQECIKGGVSYTLQSIYSIFAKPVAAGCPKWRYKCRSNTQTTAESKSVEGDYARSGRGSSANKKAAIEACHKKQDQFCAANIRYASRKTDNCKAVIDYYCHGYVKKEKVTEWVLDQESSPRTSWCSGKTNCDCDCKG